LPGDALFYEHHVQIYIETPISNYSLAEHAEQLSARELPLLNKDHESKPVVVQVQ